MNLNILEDYELLEGDIDISSLEKLIYRYVNLLHIYDVSLSDGIAPLHNLICLKTHDGSKLSSDTGDLILGWIEFKYHSDLFEGFSGSYLLSDKNAQRLVELWRSIEGLIWCIHNTTDVLPFLNKVLKESISEYELGSIKNLIDQIEYVSTLPPRKKLPDEILDKVLLRTDTYFEKQYESKEMNELFCGLRETVVEHELCYTISWCRKPNKFKPKTGWVGAGPLMVSKISEKFELMGSSPGVDWIRLFELDVQDLEEYFYLEIPYKKENILKLKTIINCNTKELLDNVNKENKIIYTQSKIWCDYRPEFQDIADNLNELGINCSVEIRIRKKT